MGRAALLGVALVLALVAAGCGEVGRCAVHRAVQGECEGRRPHGRGALQADQPRFDAAVRTVRVVQDKAFALPASPAGAAFPRAWTNAVNRVLAGRQSPTDALRRAQHEAQQAIDAAS